MTLQAQDPSTEGVIAPQRNSSQVIWYACPESMPRTGAVLQTLRPCRGMAAGWSQTGLTENLLGIHPYSDVDAPSMRSLPDQQFNPQGHREANRSPLLRWAAVPVVVLFGGMLATVQEARAASLSVSNITQTTVTLTIASHTGAWYYKQRNPERGSCLSAGTGTTANIDGLSPNYHYNYEAFSNSNCSTKIAMTTFLTKPGKPSKPTVSVSSGQLTISSTITSPFSNVLTKWQYKKKEGEGNFDATWTDISSTSASLFYTVTGLTNGTNYQFKVRAVNATGAGLPSAASDAASPQPTILSVDSTGSTRATLTIVNYTGAWYYKQRNPQRGSCLSAGTGTTANIDGLSPNYHYNYEAFSNSNCSTKIAMTTFLTRPGRPSKPTVAAGSGELTISSTIPVSPFPKVLTKWQYTKKEGEGSFDATWTDINSTSYSLSHTVTGLTGGTNYQFKVRAVNATGAGLTSAASDAASPYTATLSVSDITQATATLTIANHTGNWYYPTHAVTIVPGNSCSSAVTGTTTVITGLSPNSYYNYAAYSDSNCSTKIASAPVFLTKPGEPSKPTVSVGSGQLTIRSSISIAPPTVAGALTKWQYKKKEGEGSFDATWTDITSTSTSLSHTVTGLVNGTNYQFRVRAVNATGAGLPSSASDAASPQAITLSVADARVAEPRSGGSATLDFVVTLNPAVSGTVTVDYATSNDTATAGSDYTATSGTLTFAAGETSKTVAVTVLSDSNNEGNETMKLTLSNATGTAEISDGEATGTITTPTILVSVADATVAEPGAGGSATLDFAVTLNRPPYLSAGKVTVDYATSNDTATAGSDYTATSGTLTFAMGESSKTVAVPVLSDSHNEGSETMKLTLSNAKGTAVIGDAAIDDGEAVGTITNAGPIPQAWISRFGRTVADQVLEAVDTQMGSEPRPGSEVMLAGIPVGDGGGQDAQGLTVATLTGRELLANSSFALTSRSAGGGLLSFWGRGAVTSFEGREGDLSLDGEVTTWMVGTDWSWGQWQGGEARRSTAGLLLSRSAGDGDYAGADAGDVETTLTGVFPWARHRFTDRLEAWGAAGYGQGDLEVTPKQPGTGKDGAVIKTDLNLWLLAGGLRGTLLDGGNDGLTLTGTTDAMAVWTTSEQVTGLEAAQATVTRLRLGLEAQRPFPLGKPESGSGATLTPSLEVGLRHDGGDAETGFGMDLGGGIVLSHPERGLEAELRGRGLLSHAAEGFRDRGFSGSLSWRQKPDSDLGAALSLTQTTGGFSSGGADALLSRVTMENLEANDTSGNNNLNQRLELRFSYGFPAFGDRFTLTPELGLGLYDSGRDYRVGGSLTRPDDGESGESFAFSLDVTRRENANTAPDHGVQLEVSTQF